MISTIMATIIAICFVFAVISLSNAACEKQTIGFNNLQVCATATLNDMTAENNTELQNTMESLEKNVANVLTDLGELQNKIESLESAINQSLDKLENKIDDILHHLVNGSNEGCSYPDGLNSCEQLPSDCLSGYYVIINSDGVSRNTYCNMDKLCGDSSGGWRRIGFLNMSDTTVQCPSSDLKLYEQKGVRACGKYSSGCVSVKLPSHSISYSKVCGRVIGYQVGSPDATHPPGDINGVYLDGVSLTRGNPREHIWSFYASLMENTPFYATNVFCPCSGQYSVSTESFVGNDYFCESGSPGHYDLTTFHTDPLWDGKQCGVLETGCCNAPGIPWFYKSFNESTDDYIELRVCTNQPLSDEDVAVGLYEIYTK